MADEKIKFDEFEGELLTEEDIKLKRPDMYRIILLNDDYTPREFVVWILVRVFYKNKEEGTRIMIEAHTKGKSIVGVYTYDVARSKVMQVHQLAKQNEHPLKCELEVEEGGEEQ